MKTNKFIKRIMAWALAAALLLGITPLTMPLTAQAVTAGDLKITGGTYTYEDNVLTITSNGTYTISMQLAVDTTTDRIVVESGLSDVNITLNGVKIDRSSDTGGSDTGRAFDMAGATVNLTLAGENELESGYSAAGLNAPSGSALTISENSSGSLSVTGGNYGAGIGGGSGGAGGNVTINGGIVTAAGGWPGESAGIGGGSGGVGGNVTINGGTIITNGGWAGAGIGGGRDASNNGTLTIKGGSVSRAGAATLEAQATRGVSNLYPVTLTVGVPAVANAAVTAGSIGGTACVSQVPEGDEYGIKNVNTDDAGKLYFYLPAGEISILTMANEVNYSNNTVTITATGDNAATLMQPLDDLEFLIQPQAVTEVFYDYIYGSITALAGGPSGAVISYQWYECADDGTGAVPVEGADRDVFTIPTDLEAATYYYYCTASADGLETVTSSIAAVRVVTEISWEEAGDFLVQTAMEYNYNTTGGILEISRSGDYTVKMNEGITTTTNSIDILGNGGITVNLTLDGVKIDRSSVSGSTAMWVSENNNLYLTLAGENELKSSSGCPGLQAGTTRTIVITADSMGSLIANGGSYAAGIGGSNNAPGGNITINGGTVIAKGGYNGAGIGSGYGLSEGSSGGVLTINGGSVRRNGAQGQEAFAKNSAGESVCLTTLTVGVPAVLNSPITAGKINDVPCAVTPDAQNGIYGINGVKTDADGKLYFWLPAGEDIPLLVTANDKVYAGGISPNTNNDALATLLPEDDNDKNPFGGGDGTSAENAYEISTAEQLAWLAELVNEGTEPYANWGVYYKLTADIDLSAYGEEWNGGKGWIPIGDTFGKPFEGQFDGGGHTVNELYVNRTDDLTGLFGFVASGAVQNLGVVNADVTGNVYVGGVAGYVTGTVQNCCATGSINGTSYVGGVAGTVTGTVQNCCATGSVIGYYAVGGVAGTAYNGTVQNCYATGSISGINFVGGVTGEIYGGTVQNCAALNPSVSGSSNVGRVIGCNSSGTITNNYAYSGMSCISKGDSAGNNNYDDGTPKDTTDIAADGTLFGLFADTSIWTTENGSLPGLFGAAIPIPAHLIIVPEGPISISVNGVDISFERPEGSVVLIVAAYKDGTFVKMVTPNEDDTVVITESADTIKVMLWNSLDNMVPWYPAKTLEYEGGGWKLKAN